MYTVPPSEYIEIVISKSAHGYVIWGVQFLAPAVAASAADSGVLPWLPHAQPEHAVLDQMQQCARPQQYAGPADRAHSEAGQFFHRPQCAILVEIRFG